MGGVFGLVAIPNDIRRYVYVVSQLKGYCGAPLFAKMAYEGQWSSKDCCVGGCQEDGATREIT
jgi:hypothetical protein